MSAAPSASLIGPRQLDLRIEHERRKQRLREQALDARRLTAAPVRTVAIRPTPLAAHPVASRRFRVTHRQGLSLVSIGLLAGVVAIVLIFLAPHWSRHLPAKVVPVVVTPQLAKPSATPVAQAIAVPVKPTDRLVIPSIDVNASVTELGLLKDNSLDAPKTMWQVGHYNKSAQAGDKGTTVIDGHSGAPGQFGVLENLSQLKAGAIVTYKYVDGRSYDYRVTSSAAYGENQTGANKLFAQTTGASLNIVSCYGTWNPKTEDYSQRWIITSELIQ